MHLFIIENESVMENHPLSCYVSRQIDYSAKLSETLSSKMTTNNKDDDDNMRILSETLGNSSLHLCFLMTRP